MQLDYQLDQYVADILDGTIPASKYTIAACQRHADDLADGHKRGLTFDETSARIACAFFLLFHHYKGEWAGQPITLEPWQQFIIGSLFGWRRADGTRRFRTAYISVARKNGKTLMAAGVGLYLLLADGEPGAEVYTAATKRDQARILHGDAVQMVKRAPASIKKRVNLFKDNIFTPGGAGRFVPLGRDSKTLDGLNVHGAIGDELHAWPDRDLWDILDTATGSRRQPLMIAITTAGDNEQSYCYQLDDYTQKVNERLVDDDSFFGIIYRLEYDPAAKESADDAAEEQDNYKDPATWIKANPNLDVSKKRDDIARKLKRAAEMPSGLNSFLKREMNLWVSVAQRWITPQQWRSAVPSPAPSFNAALTGRPAFAGLDLSSTIDISALVYVFPPWAEGDPYNVLCRFWIPADNMPQRIHRDRVPFDAWERQGLIEATPGAAIDYDFILAQLAKDGEMFDIKEIAFDRWGASRMATQMIAAGYEIIDFGQGFASMSAPMKEAERLIALHQLDHNHNPILAWMAANTVAMTDPADNKKPDKKRSIERIDGIVAMIMALDRASRWVEEQSATDHYERVGLRTV